MLTQLSLNAARLLLFLVYRAGFGGELRVTGPELQEQTGIKRQLIYAARDELVREGFVACLPARGHYLVFRVLPPPATSRATSSALGISLGQSNPPPPTASVGLGEIDGLDIYLSDRGRPLVPSERRTRTRLTPGPSGLKSPPKGLPLEVPSQGTTSTRESPVVGLPALESPPVGLPGVPSQGTTSVGVPSQGTTEGVGVPSGGTTRPRSVLSRCAEADRMSDSGRLDRRGSPASRRRAAQVEAVTAAWAELFPDQPPLLPANAKDFLRLAGESAEEVYEHLQIVAERKPQHPLSYARKVFTSRTQPTRAPLPTPAPSGQSATSGPVESVGELTPPSESYLKQLAEAERLAAALLDLSA